MNSVNYIIVFVCLFLHYRLNFIGSTLPYLASVTGFPISIKLDSGRWTPLDSWSYWKSNHKRLTKLSFILQTFTKTSSYSSPRMEQKRFRVVSRRSARIPAESSTRAHSLLRTPIAFSTGTLTPLLPRNSCLENLDLERGRVVNTESVRGPALQICSSIRPTRTRTDRAKRLLHTH